MKVAPGQLILANEYLPPRRSSASLTQALDSVDGSSLKRLTLLASHPDALLWLQADYAPSGAESTPVDATAVDATAVDAAAAHADPSAVDATAVNGHALDGAKGGQLAVLPPATRFLAPASAAAGPLAEYARIQDGAISRFKGMHVDIRV